MKFFRVGICCLLAFAVVSFGAVEEWSQAVLEVGAAFLLVVWTIRQYRLKSERLTIPQETRRCLRLRWWSWSNWSFHLTASRYYTRIELQLLVTYLIVLFLMAQVFSQSSHWRGFVWFLMTLGFAISIFGILQHLTFNGKLYWFRVMRYGGLPFGPYVNRNHFAGFAEMIIPVALVPLVLGKVRRERVFLVGLLAVVPIVALFLSASRGGIISFGVQMVILFLAAAPPSCSGQVRDCRRHCGVCAACWPFLGLGSIRYWQRFTEMQNLEVTVGKRAAMRRDTFRLFLDHPIIGTGLGNPRNGLSAVRFGIRREEW